MLPGPWHYVGMERLCQYIAPGEMLGIPQLARIEDAVCGRTAGWALAFNDMDPIWVCDEHYDVLIAQGWSEVDRA
jgi:hypothetical protein